MRSDIERDLQHLDAGFPEVRPDGATMTEVVGRGRRRVLRQRIVSGLAGSALVLSALAVVPQLLERPDRTPTVLSGTGIGDDGDKVDPVIVAEPKDDRSEPSGAIVEKPPADAAKAGSEAEDPAVVEGDTTAPPIEITDPIDGSHTTSQSYTFRGTTEPGARVFAGQWEADVTTSGHWALALKLSPGKNTVTITAKDAALNRATDTVTVHYDAPAGTTKPEPKPAIKTEPKPVGSTAFTASQVHNAKEYDPPYTYYEGTAEPGTKVKATSQYGTGSALADGNGAYSFKVWFETAPVGSHTWPVTVTSVHTGQSKTFEFTGHRPGAAAPAEGFSASQENEHVEYDPPYNYYSGTAKPGTGVLVSSEYGSADGSADANGYFRIKVWFEGAPAGSHSWPVTVKSIATGEQKTFTMNGTRPQPAPEVAFTANQQYGTSNAPTPFDVFHGTAQPETKVWIDSPYGSGYTYADAQGNWEVRVEFPSAPRGKTFEVTVKSFHTGTVKSFAFTATEPA